MLEPGVRSAQVPDDGRYIGLYPVYRTSRGPGCNRTRSAHGFRCRERDVGSRKEEIALAHGAASRRPGERQPGRRSFRLVGSRLQQVTDLIGAAAGP